MAVRKLRPMTPSQRHTIVDSYDDITAGSPEKSLTESIKKSGGRNNSGKMTMRYTGGGPKRKYRFVDFKRDKHGDVGVVKSIEYDPNRTARIALVYYVNGDKRYIICPTGLKVGQKITSGETAVPEIGNALFLKDIPLGTLIHNIELRPGQGAAIARSA